MKILKKLKNFFKKLKAVLILFSYKYIPRIKKALEIERLQILSGIKTLEESKYSKTKQEALKVLKRPISEMSFTDYLSSLPRVDISKQLNKSESQNIVHITNEASKKIEALRKEIDEEAARRKEEEEIENAYLEQKYNQQQVEKQNHDMLLHDMIHYDAIDYKSGGTKIDSVVKKSSKPKVKKQNEKSNSQPKKKSVTKDKLASTNRKKYKTS